jgi:GDP-4-dehydro-6-deoxy-D-mannose reductase
MNIVVTGVNGFVGKHLVNELIANSHSVIGIGMEPVAHEGVADKLAHYVSCDLADSWPVLPEEADAIIHLAGLAAVGPSFDKPQLYLQVNSSIVTNMCEYYLKATKGPRIVLISSGAIYDPEQSMPINETGSIAFSSPYAVSKVLNENQAAYYHSRGIDCVVMRPFNHIGPGQLPGFLVPDLAEKIRAQSQKDEVIKVGNLATKRDYTDVRDVAKAYVTVATSPNAPRNLVYNVSSGKSISGEVVLATLAEAFGISIPPVEVDPSLVRPTDIMDIRGDNSRLAEEFGWAPSYEFAQTVNDFVRSI